MSQPTCIPNSPESALYYLTDTKGLKCLHYNVQSLLPKLDELRYLNNITKFDCISINESFLDCSISNDEINIDGFQYLGLTDLAMVGVLSCIYEKLYPPKLLISLIKVKAPGSRLNIKRLI